MFKSALKGLNPCLSSVRSKTTHKLAQPSHEFAKRYNSNSTTFKDVPRPIYHTPEGPVPAVFTAEHIQHIEHHLKSLPRVVLGKPRQPYGTGNIVEEDTVRRAAVLVPLVNWEVSNQERASLLYTLRSSTLRNHGGQVAFPGGIMDKEDGGDPIVTALRETQEEIGLGKEYIKPLGLFHDVVSLKGVIVTPVIAYISDPSKIHPHSLKLSTDEVQEAFMTSLEALVKPEIYKIEQLNRGKIPRYLLDPARPDKDIWGMTAYLTDWILKSIICKL